ncbi:MAG: Rrf2 family transcriptional regulator [Defluviitaleaceae bacterium]|nr:Rrf2 family transcriptional regulator [Defluviitaleaceae bacterium]
MLITKECEYGMRIIRALSSGERHTVKEVAKSESIPESFAYKVVEKLKEAGYLENRRGRDGGIRLRHGLDNITLFDVVAAIHPERYIFKCLRRIDDHPKESKKESCQFHTEFSRIQQMFDSELKSRTIKDVLAV